MIKESIKWILFIIFKISCMYFVNYYYQNYSLKINEITRIEEDYKWYLLYTIFGSLLSISMKYIFNIKSFQNFYEKFNKIKTDSHTYNDKNSLGDKMYLFVFYSLMIIGYIIYGKNTYYIPSLFGGKDLTMEYLEKNLHHEIPNNGLIIIFCFFLGHCIFRSFHHMIHGKSQVIPLFIHHNITIYLMIYTLLFRYYLIGINISFCNEFTDIFVNVIKFLHEANYYKIIQNFCFLIFILSWIILRDYIFLFKIYLKNFQIQFLSQNERIIFFRNLSYNHYIISCFILSILVILNIYWTKKIFILLLKEWGLKKKIKKE